MILFLTVFNLTAYVYQSMNLKEDFPKTSETSILSKKFFITDSSKSEITQQSLPADIYNLSSVDYNACCGLGHRLSKLSDAYYAASKLGFALRSFWGYCDAVEVYHYLFGPQPPSELTHVKHRNHFVRMNNEVAGMIKFQRNSSSTSECPCVQDKIDSDVLFYRQHRDRFRGRQAVEDYRKEHFHPNVTTVGIHIRAGNGETGDFQNRGRAIKDPSSWLRRVVELILSRSEWQKKSIQLFVATDTAEIIKEMEALLDPQGVSVLQVNQVRPAKGDGVMFGARGQVLGSGFKCWRSWESTLMDMILLSHADVVIAARPSSFTQSMPLSLVMARENEAVSHPFCEINAAASDMRCYSSYSDWCCNGDTDFALAEIRQRYEYLRMPKSGYDAWEVHGKKVQERGAEGCVPRPAGWKQVCLPYNFEEALKASRRKESG